MKTHECNWYCQPPTVHAWVILAAAQMPVEEVRAKFPQALTLAYGAGKATLEWLRPAPEAEWRVGERTVTVRWHEHAGRQRPHLCADDPIATPKKPYLACVRFAMSQR